MWKWIQARRKGSEVVHVWAVRGVRPGASVTDHLPVEELLLCIKQRVDAAAVLLLKKSKRRTNSTFEWILNSSTPERVYSEAACSSFSRALRSAGLIHLPPHARNP